MKRDVAIYVAARMHEDATRAPAVRLTGLRVNGLAGWA